MANVKVAVFDGSEFLGIKERPLRNLPESDRVYGVVFRQLVYRLYSVPSPDVPADWRIDIALRSFDADDCPVAERLGPESDPESDVDFEWYWEETDTRRYVALNGSEEDLRRFIGLLTDARIEVVNFGPSMRSASDGQVYDWYIRLPFRRGQGLEESDVSAAISGSVEPKLPAFRVVERLEDHGLKLTTDGTTVFIRGKIGVIEPELQDAMDAHKGDVIEILQERGSLESPVEAPEQDVSIDVAALGHAIVERCTDAGLDDVQIEIIRTAASTANSTGAQADIEALVELAVDVLASDLVKMRNEMKKSLKAFERLDQRTGGLENKLADFEAQLRARSSQDDPSSVVADLSARVSEMEVEIKSLTEAKTSAERDWILECELKEDAEAYGEGLTRRLELAQAQISRLGGSGRLLEETLSVLLPDVQPLRDSLSVLLTYENPVPTLQLLVKVGTKGFTAGNPIGGVQGWKDIHLSTGRDNDGRLYYRAKDREVQVLISPKVNQKEDIRWLKLRK